MVVVDDLAEQKNRLTNEGNEDYFITEKSLVRVSPTLPKEFAS